VAENRRVTTSEARFHGFLEARDLLDPAELFEFFDGLEPVELEAMFGDWDGGVLRTGHDGEAQLGSFGWVGKSFHDADRVDPIIVRNEAGERVANDFMGAATLRMIRYRAVVTATMVYDKHPIFDYFRRVSEDRVMGIMHPKSEAKCLFFWLRRSRVQAPAPLPVAPR
jgi:hypothetical protein